MQYVYHLVMTTNKRLINPSRLCYVQVGGSYKVGAPLPVGDRFKIDSRENHGYRASGEVVGNRGASELHVKGSNCFLRFTVDVVDLCFAVRTIAEVHGDKSQVGALHDGFVTALQQNREGVGDFLASIQRCRPSSEQRG